MKFSSFLGRLPFVGALLLAALSGFGEAARAQSATPTPLFFEDFGATKLDPARWGTENDTILLNRTRFGGIPTLGRDSDGTTWMRVPLSTYNSKNPGVETKGTEVFSLDKWNLNAGVEWEARLRFPAATPPGWVAGFFSYNGTGIYPDTYQQAECDFEFLPNQTGDKIWTNLWDDWSPLRGGGRAETLSSAPGLNWKDGKWHNFKLRWEPTQTTWFADGQLMRTETGVQPGGAMGVRFNAWLADPYWPEASNPNFAPASSASANQTVYYDVDSLAVRALPNPTVGPYGTGAGLSGTYFNSKDFTNPVITRIDSRLNFDWGTSAPVPSLVTDGFTVRWDGFVQARFDETYTFSTTSDDGTRLWVNGVQLVDVWQDGPANTGSGSIALKAGEKVPIRVEYFEGIGGASIRMRWSSPSTPLQLVPQSQLYPATTSPTPVPTTAPTATPVPTAAPTTQPTAVPTPKPTATPVPTAAPTATPKPTATPAPTAVPTPTALPVAATPQFSPAGGSYSSAQNVSISSATAGTTIRYTLDGSAPTQNSAILASGQTIRAGTGTTRIAARAFAAGATPSATASATYTVSVPLAVSIVTPAVNARITNFSNISGTATGAARVEVEIKRARDGKFWNGWTWLSSETAVPALLSGDTWKVVAPAANGAGLPSGGSLATGSYTIEADAYDANGKIVIVTRSVSIVAPSSAARSAGLS